MLKLVFLLIFGALLLHKTLSQENGRNHEDQDSVLKDLLINLKNSQRSHGESNYDYEGHLMNLRVGRRHNGDQDNYHKGITPDLRDGGRNKAEPDYDRKDGAKSRESPPYLMFILGTVKGIISYISMKQ